MLNPRRSNSKSLARNKKEMKNPYPVPAIYQSEDRLSTWEVLSESGREEKKRWLCKIYCPTFPEGELGKVRPDEILEERFGRIIKVK